MHGDSKTKSRREEEVREIEETTRQIDKERGERRGRRQKRDGWESGSEWERVREGDIMRRERESGQCGG